ncbi:MAG: carbohydrate-binding domain-containing protein [Acutalibacteraceae bacterium]
MRSLSAIRLGVRKITAVLATVALLMTGFCVFSVSASSAEGTLISLFCYGSGTAGTDVAGDKSTGYAANLGSAVVTASVNGADARKLEWTSDLYTYGTDSAVQPAMTGGSKNPWAAGAYIQVQVCTVGYTDICFSAKLGGTKKGPRDFVLQYSTDGTTFQAVDNAEYAITTNKTMQQAFSSVPLPDDASNAETLYIRMAVASDMLIGGTEGLAGSTGGETAVNDIVITGTGEAVFYPQGDVDQNGVLTSSDVRRLLLLLANGTTPDSQVVLLADVNGDGGISTSDARLMLQALIDGTAPAYLPESNGSSSDPSVVNGSPVVSADTLITLDGTTATVTGEGATVSGNVITVTAAGSYTVTGTMTDGQLLVASDKEGENVNLTLSDAHITSNTCAPLYIQSAANTHILLAEGTENSLTDAASYTLESGTDEPKAALFSADDLVIEGSGALTVNANYNNGIHSKDDLKINGGTLNITAVNQGIHGKDSVCISGGDITVNAGGDGIQSDNIEDTTRGYVTVTDGTLNITAGNDGIQAETALTVEGGNITVKTGGGSSTSPSSSDTESYKGFKSNGTITTTGGSVILDCKDDAIHAAGTVMLSGGRFSVSTGDDGVHSDTSLIINDPTVLTVEKSYEALEAVDLTVTGGETRVYASDDGVNGAGGTDDNSGYWYIESNLLYVQSSTDAGYELHIKPGASFDIAAQPYLVLDYNSAVPFDIVFDVQSSGASGTLSLASDWYASFGATADDVAGGYLPASNESKIVALDMKSYFDANGVPSDGSAAVSDIIIRLGGQGRICLGALQLSDSDSVTYFSATAAGTAIVSDATADTVVNLMTGIATTASSTEQSSTSTPSAPGAPGAGGGMESETTGSITITGGYLAVYADGDGLDANGDINQTGGTVIVHGPTSGANGALDYDGTYLITGGTLIAVGSVGMMQTPSTSSSQNTLSIRLSSSRSAGTTVGIKDANGNTLLAFKPSKSYQSAVVSLPSVTSGSTYTAYTGGTCSGTETDGLYTGDYSGGTSVGSATVSSSVTTIGSSSGGGFQPGRP